MEFFRLWIKRRRLSVHGIGSGIMSRFTRSLSSAQKREEDLYTGFKKETEG